MKNYIKRYLLVLGNKKKQIPLIFIFFLLASLLDLFGLSLVAPLIYSIISPENFHTQFNYSFIPDSFLSLSHLSRVIILGTLLVLIYYLKAIIGFLIHRKIVSFTLDHQAYLIQTLVKSYQLMPYTNLIQRNTSSFYNMISNHVRLYSEQTLMASLKLISETIIFVVILSFLAYSNIYALLILVSIFLFLFISYDLSLKNIYQKAGRKTADAIDNVLRSTKEAVGSLKEVRILNKESYFNEKVEKASDTYAYYGSLSQALQQIPRYLLESVIVTFIVVLAIYLIYSNQNIAESIAMLGVFGVGAIRLLPSGYQSMTAISVIRFSRHHLNELSKDLQEIKNIKLNVETKMNTDNFIFKKLKIHGLNYKYPSSSQEVLKNINLELDKGEFLGIIGESGSGKTTLVDIILGLLKPTNQENHLFLNSKPLWEQISAWQEKIAYIPQSIFLLDETIKQNITLESNDKNINYQNLKIAINTSQLEETINQLEHGLDTNVGDDGIRLSGGQRQRIILARALYHQKEIIIFDEATSSLDEVTEKSVMNDIYKFKGYKTIILISHKLDILHKCDKILNLNNGELKLNKT